MDNLFEAFNNLRILIVGDVMLDIYLQGQVDRISPEAPVPIVAVKERFLRLGGAANVAQNIKALGAEPVLCAVVGYDENANEMLALMKEHDMPTEGVVRSRHRITTAKERVIGNNAQMLRIDTEDIFDLTDEEDALLCERVKNIINNQRVDGVILQDYNKGVLTESVITKVIAWANEKNIPVSVDPKKKNFTTFRNCTFFKPNLKELKEGINGKFATDSVDGILQGVETLQSMLKCRYVMTTLSERGVLIRDGKTGAHIHLPAHLRKIADVSGAGDTVLSVAALCLALGCDAATIAGLSNLAGGLVCEELGAVPVNKDRLFYEAERLKIAVK